MDVVFSDISVDRPTADSLDAEYRTITAALDSRDLDRALTLWDAARRRFESWQALVRLRFDQDTADAAAKAERDYADALTPVAVGLDVAIKRRLLASAARDQVAHQLGRHALDLWSIDITTFDPAIADDMAEEARLTARYTELLASAEIAIDGETVNLAGIEPYAQSLDRETRHRAEMQRWEFFAAHGAVLDQLFDDLVKLRHGMARKLGYPNFTPLGYRRMRRVDYGPDEVAHYRDAVAADVVPLVAAALAHRGAAYADGKAMYWDEAIDDPAGNPGPAGDHDFLVAAASAMFAQVDPRLAAFYDGMRQGGMLDLKNRPGKAGGGFCTSFPTHGVPFIFANFNGTDHDVTVFTHEMGHAFQNWESRNQPVIDYLWPTSESAEIDSMGLEFLCHPAIGALVGEAAAERFRRAHLLSSLRFLPYGVCVDHFQHEVYANPEASPAERHAMWHRLERHYMPWRDYGDLTYPAAGGLWQAKLHIYCLPFYYIDYTLALCCALQLWADSLADYRGTVERFVKLCGRGGSAPFRDLVAGAGLTSPFEPRALSRVVAAAAERLAAG
jgi:M3 family oligoendopeptidase